MHTYVGSRVRYSPKQFTVTHKKQIELGAFGESMYYTVFFLFLFLIQGFLRQFVACSLFSLPYLNYHRPRFLRSFFVTRHKKLLLQKKEEGETTIRRSFVETSQSHNHHCSQRFSSFLFALLFASFVLKYRYGNLSAERTKKPPRRGN